MFLLCVLRDLAAKHGILGFHGFAWLDGILLQESFESQEAYHNILSHLGILVFRQPKIRKIL
jgi:hypothetical protein